VPLPQAFHLGAAITSGLAGRLVGHLTAISIAVLFVVGRQIVALRSPYASAHGPSTSRAVDTVSGPDGILSTILRTLMICRSSAVLLHYAAPLETVAAGDNRMRRSFFTTLDGSANLRQTR